MTRVSVNHNDFDLVIDPALGGSVLSCTWRDHPVLRPSPGATSSLEAAAFPMIPFSGRIQDGQFAFGGRTIKLAQNFPPEPHAIHGRCWQNAWTIKEKSRYSITLARDHDGTDWPWVYRAWQHFEILDDRLALTLSLTNQADTAMPAGIGWHPFFPGHGARLTANVSRFWEAERGDVPRRAIPCPEETDLRHTRTVSALDLDNAFDWEKRTAQITWPQQALTLTLQASAVFSHVIVFTPPGKDFFCVEPASHAPNAVNNNTPGVNAGFRILPPNETLAGTITLSLEAH